jgi:hypothetical protein
MYPILATAHHDPHMGSSALSIPRNDHRTVTTAIERGTAYGTSIAGWQQMQVLGGVADTVAQTLTAVRQRAVRKQGGVDKDDFVAIEIHELDRRNPINNNDLIPDSKLLPPPFDFERTVRFMSYGFIMSPLQLRWFKFLSSTFPMAKTSTWLPALKRVSFDQFLFAPAGKIATKHHCCCSRWHLLGLACFFTFMTVAEGGGKRAVQRKFQDIYVPALKANWLVWPTVQLINFRVMPIQYQIVRVAHSNVLMLLMSFSAVCLHRRYRLDSIPLPDELRRRCNRLDDIRLSLYILGPSALRVSLGSGLGQVGIVEYPFGFLAPRAPASWSGNGVEALFGYGSVDPVSENELQFYPYPSLDSKEYYP